MIEYYCILSAFIGIFVLFAGAYEIVVIKDEYIVWKNVLLFSVIFLCIWPFALTKFLWERVRS